MLTFALSVSLAAAEPWENRADPPEKRAAALLKAMTQEEKYSMLHGPPSGPCCQCTTNASCAYVGNINAIPRLKIPPITMNDGPQGFRDNNNPGSTTAWPSGLTMAASWDTDALEKWGVGMGKEFFAKGSNVQLGPGLCLARVPRNGRNFEYLSGEDPMLGYVLSQPAIKGIQSQGVIANAKHYVMNDQETNRASVSEEVDERTRYQMYYPPFAGALDADVGSIMCSVRDSAGLFGVCLLHKLSPNHHVTVQQDQRPGRPNAATWCQDRFYSRPLVVRKSSHSWPRPEGEWSWWRHREGLVRFRYERLV